MRNWLNFVEIWYKINRSFIWCLIVKVKCIDEVLKMLYDIENKENYKNFKLCKIF